MDVAGLIMSYMSVGDLRLVMACGGPFKATAVAVLDQDSESRRWRDELDAVVPGLAAKISELPPQTYRSLVEALILEKQNDGKWPPSRPIEKTSDTESMNAWLREGVLIAVVRAEDLRRRSAYRRSSVLFAGAWNMGDLCNYWCEDLEASVPSIYHRRVADAPTMRYVNELVALDLDAGGGVCQVTTSIFALHPPSGALVMVSADEMSPDNDNDDDLNPWRPEDPILARTALPPGGIDMTTTRRPRSIPLCYPGTLPRLTVDVATIFKDMDDEGRSQYEVGTPISGDVADYFYEASWGFRVVDIEKLRLYAFEVIMYNAVYNRHDDFNPLHTFAHYLSSLMPLTIANENHQDPRQQG